jgi:SAM-dependent methyltransferase
MLQQDSHNQLERQYGLVGLRSRFDLTQYDPMVNFNVEQLESAILTGLSSEVLRVESLRGRVVDFGCGRGVSTALLHSYGGDVTGVELSATSVSQGKELGFVPQDRIKCTDGIEYLKSLPPKSLDLVTCSMLGPDIQGGLCRDFLEACHHALKPSGVILVTSDAGTMATLERVNPLGNGFTTKGVFLAVRGLDELHSSTSDLGLFSFRDLTSHRPLKDIDIYGSLKNIDFEALLKRLKSDEGPKG